MKLYHGSTTLFDRPAERHFGQGFTSSEFGVGFYTSDYGGDAWEYAGGTSGEAGVIYSYELDEARLDKWLVWGRPLGQTLYDSLMRNLDRLPPDRADQLREELSPTMDGRDAFGVLRGRSREGSRFMRDAGVEGTACDSYYVFLSANAVPAQNIHQIVGDFPAAEDALARQKETGRLSVEQPVKADGTLMGPREHYMSEELRFAALKIHDTKDRDLIDLFETKIAAPLLSDAWMKSGGPGFDIRNNLGSSFQRILRDGGLDLSDHWSGANSLIRTTTWMKHNVNGAEPLIENANRVADALRAHVAKSTFG